MFLLRLFLSNQAVIFGCFAAKILLVAPPGSESHLMSMYPLANLLGQRGHSVTMFIESTRKPFTNDSVPNVTLSTISIELDIHKSMENRRQRAAWKIRSFTSWMLYEPWLSAILTTETLLSKHWKEFNETVLDRDWDLILVDSLFTPTGIVTTLLKRIQPVVYHTTAISASEAILRSLPYPSTTIPAMYIPEPNYDHRRFGHRLTSFLSDWSDILAQILIDRFTLRARIEQLVPEISMANFFHQSKFALVDYPMSFDYPRPTTFNTIYIGNGCKGDSKPQLSEDYLNFVNDSKSRGTLVIAFGHMVKLDSAPDKVKAAFFNALKRLRNYRVVFQYGGRPSNESDFPHVIFSKWIPQEALLNHPKTKLFITHGGLKSIKETVCAEQPALIIPFFAEQMRNAFLLCKAGAALSLEKLDLNEDALYGKIAQILRNQSFKAKIVKIRKILVDAPKPALENGAFWVEFFSRHSEVPDRWFRLRGGNFAYYKYASIDTTICLVATFLFFCISLSYFIIKCYPNSLSK